YAPGSMISAPASPAGVSRPDAGVQGLRRADDSIAGPATAAKQPRSAGVRPAPHARLVRSRGRVRGDARAGPIARSGTGVAAIVLAFCAGALAQHVLFSSGASSRSTR